MTALRRFGLLAPLAALSLAGCGLNSVPTAEEQVNAAWGNLQSEYQRRSDLIPNLVATVQGLCQAGNERADRSDRGAGQRRPACSSAPPTSTIPAKVRAFNEAQGRLGAGDHPAAAAAGGLSGAQVERRIS